MANLQDNIRVSTQVDMQQLDELILKYKDLKVNVTNVAAAARAMSEIQKAEIRSILAAEQVAENERDGRSERRRLNKITNAKLETQAELDAIKIQSAASKAKYDEELKSIALYNAQMRQKALETRNAQVSSNSLFQSLNSLTKLRSELITLFGAYSIGSFAQQMVEAQSKVESFQLGMKNLLGEKFGARLTEDLKKFTVETPLNFENVIDYTNKLVGAFKATGASSREISEQVTPTLESLGNTAAALGGGDRLGRLIYAFSQVQATGRLMGTEVRQITETGFPLLAVMAQQTGKSVQELQKDISNGKVSFEQFQKAILSAGKEGGVFAGAMDIMANTVQGRIDKMKETVFFALANIGKQFNESAKDAVNFASSAIDSLFGTENATKRTIEVVSTAIKTWVAYNVVTKLVAAQSVILNTIERAGLILRGEMVLANIALTGSTEAFTFAQLRAAAAARAFNTVAAANPLGLVVLAIGAATAAYQIYSSSVEEANQFTYDSIKATDSDVKSLMTKQSQLNATAKSALSLAEGTEGYRLQVGQLIKKYPEYFGNLDAERASHEDIRRALFFANNEMERKIKLMVQEKLAEKLADRSADLKIQIAQEEIAAQTIIDKRREYQQKQLELKKKGLQDEYQEQLGAYQATVTSLDQSNKKLADLRNKDAMNQKLQQRATNDLLSSQQEDYQVRRNAIITKWNNKEFETRKQFTDAITALDLEFGYGSTKRAEGSAKGSAKAGKEAAEKALKYQADTAEQIRIANQKIWAEDLEDSRQKELLLRNFEYRNQQERIKNAIGSQAIKNRMLLDLEQQYDADITKLHQKWDDRDRKEAIKAEKEKNKAIEKEAMESAERLWKIITDRIDDELKAKEKLIDELQKLDEKNSKETIKLEEDKYKLMDKLRILQAISKAKNSKEIIELENKEKEEILKSIKSSAEKQVLEEKSKLYKMWLLKKENTVEYKEQQNIILKSEQDLAGAQIKLVEFVTDKTKDEIEKRQELNKKGLDFVLKSTNAFFDAIDSALSNSMNSATDLVEKAQFENQKTTINIAKEGLSAIGSFVSGDLVSGTFKALNFLYNALESSGNNAARLAKANLEKATILLKNYLSVVEKDVDNLMSKFDEIKETYGQIAIGGNQFVKDLTNTKLLDNALELLLIFKDVKTTIEDIAETSGLTMGDLIQGEINRGQQIQKNYETAVSNEKELFDKNISNIQKIYDDKLKSLDDIKEQSTKSVNEIYDNEIKRINDSYNESVRTINAKYDLEATRASQKYDAETLAILKNGSIQLEALIGNEISLNSVRDEFSKKRQFILDSYALANKTITSDMTQEEIDGINNAIKARDEALAKLQKWYNDELTFIVNSEGQKRKEYSDTEKIQNEINDRLDKAAIKFNADEIQRATNKNIELKKESDKKDAAELLALTVKNSAILIIDKKYLNDKSIIEGEYNIAKELETTRHNGTLVLLEQQKNKDIADSFKILTSLLEIYATQISTAMESSAAKGTEAFKELENQLLVINSLLTQIRGGNINLPFTIPTIAPITIPIIPFEKGTDNTSLSLNGQPTIDNRGGKPAILHPDEAVFSKANMSEMTKALGYRPSRDEVIEKFKMGLVNMKSTHSPYVIPKLEAKGIGNVDKLGDKIDSLVREVMKKQTPQIIMNERGIKTYLLGVNSKIEAKMNRFK